MFFLGGDWREGINKNVFSSFTFAGFVFLSRLLFVYACTVLCCDGQALQKQEGLGDVCLSALGLWVLRY